MIAESIRANRSCRRFEQNDPIPMRTLLDLVDLGRLSASAGNLQPLKYILSNTPQTNAEIFDCLSWAAYLKDWPGPSEGERPAAYIIVLHDTSITNHIDCDHGIAGQSILLGAREMELAGCMLGAINQSLLRSRLKIPEHLKILLVLAIGKPREHVVAEEIDSSGDIRYFRDSKQVHHVPKRSLDEIVIARYTGE